MKSLPGRLSVALLGLPFCITLPKLAGRMLSCWNAGAWHLGPVGTQLAAFTH